MQSLVIFLAVLQSSFSSVVNTKDFSQDPIFIDRALNYEDFEFYGLNLTSSDSRIAADAFLTTPELIIKYGYKAEIHHVQTPDGYVLEMHRIPNPSGTPVYMQHGLMDSSAGWVIMGPHSSFAYYLADLGYDVWLGNIRGNRYSRKHIFLSTRSKKFWDYSFNEIGSYDVPSMVDYVLEKTGYKQLHYIGHSQGTTAFWTMCVQRPGYCDKILSMNALAPVAFLGNAKSPIIRALSPFVNQLDFLFKLMGAHEFLPNKDFFKMAGQALCKETAITHALCLNTIFLITGYNSEQLNKTMLPAVLGHLPAGSSTKQFIHYGQLVKSGQFRMFDFGWFNNLRTYRSFSPPSYDLSKVTAPVALYYSLNDWLADVKDVAKLQQRLPNVIRNYLVPLPKFNHLDFLIAMNARELVQYEVVKVMKQAEEKKKIKKD